MLFSHLQLDPILEKRIIHKRHSSIRWYLSIRIAIILAFFGWTPVKILIHSFEILDKVDLDTVSSSLFDITTLEQMSSVFELLEFTIILIFVRDTIITMISSLPKRYSSSMILFDTYGWSMICFSIPLYPSYHSLMMFLFSLSKTRRDDILLTKTSFYNILEKLVWMKRWYR